MEMNNRPNNNHGVVHPLSYQFSTQSPDTYGHQMRRHYNPPMQGQFSSENTSQPGYNNFPSSNMEGQMVVRRQSTNSISRNQHHPYSVHSNQHVQAVNSQRNYNAPPSTTYSKHSESSFTQESRGSTHFNQESRTTTETTYNTTSIKNQHPFDRYQCPSLSEQPQHNGNTPFCSPYNNLGRLPIHSEKQSQYVDFSRFKIHTNQYSETNQKIFETLQPKSALPSHTNETITTHPQNAHDSSVVPNNQSVYNSNNPNHFPRPFNQGICKQPYYPQPPTGDLPYQYEYNTASQAINEFNDAQKRRPNDEGQGITYYSSKGNSYETHQRSTGSSNMPSPHCLVPTGNYSNPTHFSHVQEYQQSSENPQTPFVHNSQFKTEVMSYGDKNCGTGLNQASLTSELVTSHNRRCHSTTPVTNNQRQLNFNAPIFIVHRNNQKTPPYVNPPAFETQNPQMVTDSRFLQGTRGNASEPSKDTNSLYNGSDCSCKTASTTDSTFYSSPYNQSTQNNSGFAYYQANPQNEPLSALFDTEHTYYDHTQVPSGPESFSRYNEGYYSTPLANDSASTQSLPVSENNQQPRSS